MPKSMKAVVIYEAGGPEVLKIEERPIPSAQMGQVLVKVKAFGMNRSELFTRQGHSPVSAVRFPRILGIEAVGEVELAPGGEFEKGTIVATAMGGMGRAFDGGYAQYTLVPVTQVQALKTTLDWSTLCAIPEMYQTAWGSLFKALGTKPGHTLLVRGGTTSVGMAAAALAKAKGILVTATTRRPDRVELLKEIGADHVFIDSGTISEQVRQVYPGGVDKVLELVGTTTLLDSLQCVAEGGAVCMTGMVGDEWEFENFSPMAAIPTAVNLTTYAGGPEDFMQTPLQEIVEDIESGKLVPRIGRVFSIDQIVEAHSVMEKNEAEGKIVVLTD